MSPSAPDLPGPTRLVTPQDVPALAELLARNRAFMAPWDAARGAHYYSVEGQTTLVATLLAGHRAGTTLPHVILDDAGAIAGRITVNGIVRGPFLSGSVGYWVSEDRCGRGLATAALAHIRALAFGPLGLHRLQAETLADNLASQRVLARNGFERYGMAPQYLHIAGRWQDHVMFQALNPDPVPVSI